MARPVLRRAVSSFFILSSLWLSRYSSLIMSVSLASTRPAYPKSWWATGCTSSSNGPSASPRPRFDLQHDFCRPKQNVAIYVVFFLLAKAYAQRHGMAFFEISPLCNYNVAESLAELTRRALRRNGMERLWRTNRGKDENNLGLFW